MTDKATSFSNRNLSRNAIQKGSMRVPFGADLYMFCGKENLHPNLVKLFKYVKMNTPRHLPMPVYSKSSWWESKWLKRSLQKGDLQAMNSYSPAAYILALRNFIKHLPSSPLLQRRSFVKLADDIRALPASHWTLAILQSRKALRTLRPVEYSLLHHLVDMLRNLCFDNEILNQSRLQEMTTLFGPVLIRKRADEPVTSASKPCTEAIALIRFMVLHGPAIFMEDSESLGDPGGASNTASMVNQASASCSIVDDTPLNYETLTFESLTNETPTNETPTNETPTNETPTNETPTNEIPTNETPTNETLTDETQAEVKDEEEETPKEEQRFEIKKDKMISVQHFTPPTPTVSETSDSGGENTCLVRYDSSILKPIM